MGDFWSDVTDENPSTSDSQGDSVSRLLCTLKVPSAKGNAPESLHKWAVIIAAINKQILGFTFREMIDSLQIQNIFRFLNDTSNIDAP